MESAGESAIRPLGWVVGFVKAFKESDLNTSDVSQQDTDLEDLARAAYGTDPEVWDFDGDDLMDGYEVAIASSSTEADELMAGIGDRRSDLLATRRVSSPRAMASTSQRTSC